MRKLLMIGLAVLLLAPTFAEAQQRHFCPQFDNQSDLGGTQCQGRRWRGGHFVNVTVDGTLTAASLQASGLTMTGQLLVPDGVVGAPAIAFSGAPTTGIYRSSSSIQFAISGALAARFTASTIDHYSDAAIIRLGAANDVVIARDAATVLALKNGTNAQTLNVYNSFTTTSNYGRFSINATATGTHLIGQGLGATAASGALLSIQGSKSKTLTDAAAATPFMTVAVPTNGWVGGEIGWTATSVSGSDQLTTVGRIRFAGATTSTTPVCTVGVIGTDLAAVSGGGNTLVCTWTNVVAAQTCALSVTCTNDLAAAQAITLYGRADMQIPATLVFP